MIKKNFRPDLEGIKFFSIDRALSIWQKNISEIKK